MEAYEQGGDSKIYNIYSKTRSWISSFLGVLLTLLGVAVIFVVASLEGTKEIVASNTDSGKILSLWRETHIEEIYPDEKVDLIYYNGREYYFVIDVIEDGVITEWHFAYDGGLEYIFGDFKFYVMTLLTIAISTFISSINYTSTLRSVMGTEVFSKTLKHYQEKKENIAKYTQYIPDFCVYKNKQSYENAKRDIIEEAGINYDFYISKEFDIKKIEKWQKKILNKIKKIKVAKIKTSDLLQEHGIQSLTKIKILPMGQQEHQRNFMISGLFQKIVNSALSGLVVAFGVVLGNWYLGLTYGFTVFMSFISAVIVSTDFANTTLRNRYLAKADLLNEFDNIKEIFIAKTKQNNV